MPKKVTVPVEHLYPPVQPHTSWLVLGLDLSVSRSGYALFKVSGEGIQILGIGSIKPKDIKMQVWSRCALTSRALLEVIRPLVFANSDELTGFLVASEAATPRNDFLSSVHRVSNTVLFGKDSKLWDRRINLLNINASTLRSTLGLIQRGATNKKENIAKAYEFIDESAWPGLDTDSCDAVLMGAMGNMAALILMGLVERVPVRYRTLLCDAAKVVKGSDLRPRIETKGLFHCPRYWFSHDPGSFTVELRDAHQSRKAKTQKILIPL